VNYHFIGVGGIGMSALAGYLLGEGHRVTGSDISENVYVKKLIEQGLKFKGKHSQKNIDQNINTVIITSAISDNNEELIAAQNAKITIIKRGKFLAELIKNHKVIAISGSHGKTTTSGLVAHLLTSLRADPSYILGGVYKNSQTHFHKGLSEFCVVEADESDKSFLYLSPYILSINNVDNDHLDNYGSMDNLCESFAAFAAKAEVQNQIINMNCSYLNKMFTSTLCFKVGTLDCAADLQVEELSVNKSGTVVTITYLNKTFDAQFSLWGQHNIENLAIALGCILRCGYQIEEILPHLATFQGMKRRMDKIGTVQNIPIFDDYAHHPSEILALYKMSSRVFKNPLIIHQPHRFSRVQSCWCEYVEVLNQIKNLELMEIYPAGEKSIEGVSSNDLLNAIKMDKSPFKNITDLNTQLNQFDAIIFCGAGNISDMARSWINDVTAE